MDIKRFTILILILGTAIMSCGKKQPQQIQRVYLLEQIGTTLIVQTYADGFESLSLPEKVTAYHLNRAAIAGRDIAYDQIHRNAIEIRNILEAVISHPEGIDSTVYNKILEYTKLFWINNGMYNYQSREKFVPEVDFITFVDAVKTAQLHGADFGLKPNETIEQKLNTLKEIIFNPNYEPLLANKSPKPGEDILKTSANNLYEGLTAKEAQAYFPKAKNLLNSKMSKQGKQIVELVYRAGDKTIPPGLYAKELSNVITELDSAAKFATEPQKNALKELVKYFKTGDLNDFRNFNIAWVKDSSTVDFINGFIEVYLDALGQKAQYEGGVFFVDKKTTQLMKGLADNAQYFEERMPWDDKYKQSKPNVPVARSINLINGTGELGPSSPSGINLPNEQDIREKYGSKSVLLNNITTAAQEAVGPKAVNEFALPEERDAAIKYSKQTGQAEIALHEVIGHGSGKVNPALKADPAAILKDYYSAMEEARAELVALYQLFDQKLIELGILPNKESAEAAYRSYARGDLLQLRRVKTGDTITDDHMKATHLIIQYLMKKTGVIEKIKSDGKSYYKVTDIDRMRAGIADLLSQLMQIKAEGDYNGIKTLMDTYGTKIDTELRDEVIARCSTINYPSYYAYCFPELEAVRNTAGDVIDVNVTIPKSFTEQQLNYSQMFKK